MSNFSLVEKVSILPPGEDVLNSLIHHYCECLFTSRSLTKELEKCIHLTFSNQNSWIRKNESSLVDDRLGKQRALQLWLRPVLKVPQIFVDIIFLPRCEKHTSDENPSYWKMLGTWDPKWHWCISICHCIPEVPTCSSEWLTRRRGNSA